MKDIILSKNAKSHSGVSTYAETMYTILLLLNEISIISENRVIHFLNSGNYSKHFHKCPKKK